MPQTRLKLYFLGSGDFAVPAARTLAADSTIELVGVGTQLDRPAGRKRRPVPTPVGEWARDANVPVDKIPSVNAEPFHAKIDSLKPDVILVAAFGQILRKRLLRAAPLGCVNLHASLLPAHRGASPIAASILAGDETTGVTIMRMDEGLDTGPIYRRFELPLSGTETADELELSLGELAASRVVAVLNELAGGGIEPEAQDDSKATYAGKIRKRDGALDWSEDAELLERKIRAFHPWPGMRCAVVTSKKSTGVRITNAEVKADISNEPGVVVRADKREWVVACGRGALSIVKLVPDGKREMGGAEFLRGFPIVEGSTLPRLKNA